ncbi:hypothetical protein J4444_01660 [Candidatus Woesearchaeota archaeon]|nr:hypothetical protein [Candidatus Woesearchaeota archaeon]
MIDRTLINKLEVMAKKEKIAKSFSRRLRVRGILTTKSQTKKGNLIISVCKGENEHRLMIPKTHKERFSLASKLPLGSKVAVEGIKSKFIIICAKLKALEAIDNSKQTKLLD